MSENKIYQPHKSSLGGLDANVLALLTYLAASIVSFIPGLKYVAWLAPGLIYLLEKSSKLVKSHAAQALTINIVGSVFQIILKIIALIVTAIVRKTAKPSDIYDLWDFYGNKGYAAVATVGTIFFFLSLAVSIVILVFEILAMVNAYKYSEYKIPIIGSLAEKIAPLLDKFDLGGSKAPPPAGANFDPQTGQPVAPPPPPPGANFDPQTGQPLAPPPPPGANFDPQTGQPLNQTPPTDDLVDDTETDTPQ